MCVMVESFHKSVEKLASYTLADSSLILQTSDALGKCASIESTRYVSHYMKNEHTCSLQLRALSPMNPAMYIYALYYDLPFAHSV